MALCQDDTHIHEALHLKKKKGSDEEEIWTQSRLPSTQFERSPAFDFAVSPSNMDT